MDRDYEAPKTTKTPPKTATAQGAGKGTPAPIDWERIELDYRAGVKSLREIAEGSGTSHVNISKRAKKFGWVRDLAAKIQARADEIVNKATVNRSGNAVNAISERETIEANAQAVSNVKLAHRTDIQRSRKLVMSLLSELEQQTDPETLNLLHELGDIMRQEDDKGQDKRNDLYRKVIDLSGRVKTMKDLSESLRVLVAMERQAFGLDDKDNAPTDALTTLLHTISKSNGNAFMPVAVDPEHEDD